MKMWGINLIFFDTFPEERILNFLVMRINSNILSLSAQRNLANTTRAISRALQRLSSGYRVNSARDDAAGLAIGNALESQRRGLVQNIRNINDARGFLNTAEGGLAIQSELLQRMRELSLQSANGTLSSAERGYLNGEFQQLLAEFDRISKETTFNGRSLLNGSENNISIQVGTQKNQTLQFSLPKILSEEVLPSVDSSTITIGSGTYSVLATFSTNRIYIGKTADLNGDGDVDFIYGLSSTNIGIRLGNGNGTFQAAITYSATQARDFKIVDVNGDGKLDMFAANTSVNYVAFYLGNGDGTFQNPTTFLGDSTIYGVETADFNGDNKLDFISNNYSAGTVNIYLGNGDGTFQARTTTLAGSTAQKLVAADFNGDGKQDFITPRYTFGSLFVVLGNGDGTFQVPVTITAGNNPVDPSIGDLNEDGKIDVVVANENSDTISIYFGNGDGTFQTQRTYSTGSSPGSTQVIDLDEDGSLDILTADSVSNFVTIFRGNGDGTFQAATTLASSTEPVSVMIDDLNGDDINDILIGNDGAGISQSYGAATEQVILSEEVEINILTQASAEDMLEILDSAMVDITSARAQIGAYQNRLQFAESISLITKENISSSISAIKDADMSSEVAEFTRLQILQTAGLAVLSQANLSTKMTLRLLQSIR